MPSTNHEKRKNDNRKAQAALRARRRLAEVVNLKIPLSGKLYHHLKKRAEREDVTLQTLVTELLQKGIQP